MSVKIYVPRDSGALALGAEKVAARIASEIKARGVDAKLVRNGSRGLYWLEPMVEVETAAGRIAYGPVTAKDVPGLFDADFLSGGKHALSLGDPEKIPYLARQTRLTFARVGITDPLSLADYKAHGGLAGLEKALKMTPAEIVQQVTDSGLRGRGGAGFPTGIKWKTVLDTPASQKYIACNADEGDSGTFSDRMIMEGDPFVLIEGMAIAGIAVGATRGYIYIRSEYPHAVATMREAIGIVRREGLLGPSVLGSSHAFDMEVRVGAGAYVCGEEAAAAGAQGPVRQADGHQQRHFARLRAHHPRQGCGLLQGFRPRPLARHHPHPDRRQRQISRPVRGGFRTDAWRDRRRDRRRHEVGPAGARRAGGRPARRIFPARALRHALRL
jgi:formate dehydrogenase iron-sulfur subunit